VWIVQIALKRPYTFVVLALLIAIFGTLAAVRTPADKEQEKEGFSQLKFLKEYAAAQGFSIAQ
jgi:hypothetical protein